MADDKVGYGRPPKRHRFRPGQSGNPGGRPKGARTLQSDLVAELRELVLVRENGRKRKLTKQRAVVRALVDAALKGDVRATNALFSFCSKIPDDRTDANVEAPLGAEDADIIDVFVERAQRGKLADQVKTQPQTNESKGNK
jgi:uncharacterized protein DUF5681